MADVFKLNQEASKRIFVSSLTAMRNQGAGVLDSLETARLDSLVEFDRRLQAINARRTRSWRVLSPEQALKFVVSDFTDIDQANTTGTVRADSSSTSLRERTIPTEAVIRSKNFSSDKGTIEALDTAQSILRVHTDDFSTPTGQFDIELVAALTISQLTIDIVATPSSPVIVVSISTDGLTYVPASQIALNGYRVNVWLPKLETRFIRMQITPSHPDDLSGNTFTFGITSFSAQATDYHLRSELVTKPLVFFPRSEFVVFDAPDNPRVQYYISITPATSPLGPFIEINVGDAIATGTTFSSTLTLQQSMGGLIAVLPSDTYINTILVKENGLPLRFAPGLPQVDSLGTELVNEYVSTNVTSIGYDLLLVRGDGNYSATRTFFVSYVYGPAQMRAQLKVRLSTDDRATSPVFHQASLNEI